MLDVKGRAGAILNIIIGSWILFIFFVYLFLIPFNNNESNLNSLITWWLVVKFILILLPIFTIVSNKRFLKGKNNQVSAGVWGILFGGVIGGLLVIFSEGNPINEDIEN